MNKDVNTRRKITWINKRNKIAYIGLTLSFNYWMTHLPLVLVSQKPIFQLDLNKKTIPWKQILKTTINIFCLINLKSQNQAKSKTIRRVLIYTYI